MVTFSRGLEAEDRIQTKLESYGCSIQANPVLDHQHKLDFALTQFPGTQRFFSVGVQVTQKLNDPDKLQHFYQATCDEQRVTERAIYLELAPGLDLDHGGGLAVFIVLAAFAFDQQYANIKAIGGVINKDCSYSFFDLKERTTELILAAEKAARGPAVKVTSQLAQTLQGAITGQVEMMSGYVHAFSRAKNIGFITAVNGSTYFFSRNAVIDDRLEVHLNGLPFTEKPLPIQLPVRFADLGKQRGDAKYNSAGRVELDC